ncbi:MAG: 3-deoxy-D-manno-octulosonic acid transferase [Acidobacteriaceae bacterium]
MPIVLFLYSCALLLVMVLGLPYWLFRMATSGKYRAGLSGRLGRVPQSIRHSTAGKKTLWVHAVSVGEVLAVSRVVQELRAALPEWAIVVSTTTRTGQELARQRFGAENVFYFPIDLPWIVQRYLRVLQPRALVLAETEFWPNLMHACCKQGIPITVVNARISDRSFPRYKLLRVLWSRILPWIAQFLAQSEDDARRLVAIGAPEQHVQVSGNLKFDVRAAAETELTRVLRSQLPAAAKLLICGSTLEGEERAMLDCWPALLALQPNSVLLLAPRHPERFDVVARILNDRGIPWQRRTEWMQQPAPIPAGSILLLDSIGELASVYSLATVAFVGGSLIGAGGHNPLEPAQFGVPVVMGDSYENFRGIVAAMEAGKAICIVQPAQLCAVLQGMWQSDAEAQAMGARGREVYASQAGATGRTVQALLDLLRAAEEQP